jgi:hypothetical protein
MAQKVNQEAMAEMDHQAGMEKMEALMLANGHPVEISLDMKQEQTGEQSLITLKQCLATLNTLKIKKTTCGLEQFLLKAEG